MTLMKIEFEADYRDFAETAFQIWKQRASGKQFYLRVYSFALFAAISCVPVIVFSNAGLLAGGFVFLFIFMMSFYFYRSPSKNHFLKDCYKRLGNDFYEIDIEVSERGILSKQLGDEYLFGWENLRIVKETDDRIHLFMKYSNGLSIPKRAFHNPAEIGQFVAFAKSQLPAATESLVK